MRTIIVEAASCQTSISVLQITTISNTANRSIWQSMGRSSGEIYDYEVLTTHLAIGQFLVLNLISSIVNFQS